MLKIFTAKSNSAKKMQSLFDKIEGLLDSARSLYTQSENLKKVVESEMTSVQQSSSAALEISSMVSTTADAANDLSQTAFESNKAVESSDDALRELSELISIVDSSSQSLQTSVKSGLAEISSVTNTMSQIKDKAGLINEIVFQTKLLSFNASVEAARAGEHGKGFAVVAEEMGNLARASGIAAKEIETILSSSVEKTKLQIERVTTELERVAEDTIKAIDVVSKKTVEISSAFAKLTDYSKNTESKSQEISSATNEQRIGVAEISKSLESLEASSHQLDQMALDENKNAAHLASAIEAISNDFFEIAKTLGYSVSRMAKPFDFDAAVKAHIDWKMKLSKYLENPDGTLEHSKVCRDNACALGQWIYGDGQRHRESEKILFEQLKVSHASFHKSAGAIIQLANQNQIETAKQLLGPTGDYIKVSEKTVELIKQLKAKVEKIDAGRNAA